MRMRIVQILQSPIRTNKDIGCSLEMFLGSMYYYSFNTIFFFDVYMYATRFLVTMFWNDAAEPSSSPCSAWR